MTHTTLKPELARAQAAVEKGVVRVRRQRELTAEFAFKDHEPEAENVRAALTAFEHILSMIIEDRDRLKRELYKRETGGNCAEGPRHPERVQSFSFHELGRA